MYLTCFAILHLTVRESFLFLENESLADSEDLRATKKMVLGSLYEMNPSIDRNKIQSLIDHLVLVCVIDYQKHFGHFRDLDEYLKFCDPIND